MHYLQWCTIYNVRTYLFEWYLFESADFTFEQPFNSLNIYIRSDLFNKFTPKGTIIGKGDFNSLSSDRLFFSVLEHFDQFSDLALRFREFCAKFQLYRCLFFVIYFRPTLPNKIAYFGQFSSTFHKSVV